MSLIAALRPFSVSKNFRKKRLWIKKMVIKQLYQESFNIDEFANLSVSLIFSVLPGRGSVNRYILLRPITGRKRSQRPRPSRRSAT